MATQHEAQHNQEPARSAGSRAQNEQGLERTQNNSSSMQPAGRGYSPLSLIRRFDRDMDRLFRGFFGSSPFRWPDWSELAGVGNEASFWPEIEVHHAGDKLIVQADVPGLKKEDIKVEVRNNELCISGERRSETERNEGQYYHSERSYGRFSRTVPLPEGTKPDSASATFENGVLRVEMQAPGGGQQPHRIEVREGSPH